MGEIGGNIHLRRLQTRLGAVVYEMTKVNFSQYCPPEAWQPAINAYRLKDCIRICVDLAGIDRSLIDLTVEPGRLWIRGFRQPPEPSGVSEQPQQILAMEIDCGPFEREVALPPEVDAEKISAEQQNGLLWIYLPLRPEA